MSSREIPVVDSHIHLAQGWQDGSGMPNSWLATEPASFQRNWTEADLADVAGKVGPTFGVKGYVFVECSNEPALAEAKWVLKMCQDPASKVCALIGWCA